MKKYRIVKTEGGDYKIQKSILFGLFWAFAKEPIASYSNYLKGYEFDFRLVFSYKSAEEANMSIDILKSGKKKYRRYHIVPFRTKGYSFTNTYGYMYFVNKGLFNSLYTINFSSVEDAKMWIDKQYSDIIEDKKRYKIKEIVKYC